MPTDGRRPKRVAERLREHLARVVVTELTDPRLLGLSVTHVEMTPDLGYGDVYVRAMGALDERAQAAVVQALGRARGRLRRDLGSALGLRRVPELRFHYDTGPDARARVEELLDEWRREQKDQ